MTARDGLILDLTGTAILNRPRELCQQLTILGRIGEFGGPKAFLWRYCLSETNEWGASYNGARNLLQLHDRLRAWGLMIRRSDDAALGLPPCREHVLCIPQADLDPAVMDRYRQAEADLLGYLAEQARQAARQLGEDPDSAAVQAVMRASAAEHLVAIGALRQLAGQANEATSPPGSASTWPQGRRSWSPRTIATRPRVRRRVRRAQAPGRPVRRAEGGRQGGVPAAARRGRAGHLGGDRRRGSRTHADRGPDRHPGRAGLDPRRDPADEKAAAPHRPGPPVDYYITVAEGTIDEHLWQVVTAKQATLDAVLDGRSDQGAGDDEASVAAELTWRLTQQGLSGAQPVSGIRRSPGPGARPHGDGARRHRRETRRRPSGSGSLSRPSWTTGLAAPGRSLADGTAWSGGLAEP